MKAEIIQVLASFVGSFGFAVLYNLRGKKLSYGWEFLGMVVMDRLPYRVE